MNFWNASTFMEPTALVDLARATEAAGFEGLMVSDHIVYPEYLTTPYPYSEDGAPPFDRDTPWPDPWVAIGAMGAVTERLRFTTNIYVAGARSPFTVAKQVGTAAVLTSNRVALGVGAGWMREEFELMGQPFGARGRRLDEMLGVLAELWAGGIVEHHGEFYDFGPLSITPTPTEPVPVFVGGDSDVALRRAARHDGWIGNVYPTDQAFATAERMVQALREAGREPGDGFELILSVYALDDLDLFRRLEDAGVTSLVTAPWMMAGDSWDDRRAAIERFGEQVIAKLD